jgi:hypothetical protein
MSESERQTRRPTIACIGCRWVTLTWADQRAAVRPSNQGRWSNSRASQGTDAAMPEMHHQGATRARAEVAATLMDKNRIELGTRWNASQRNPVNIYFLTHPLDFLKTVRTAFHCVPEVKSSHVRQLPHYCPRSWTIGPISPSRDGRPIDKKVQCFAGHRGRLLPPGSGILRAFSGASGGWCWGRRERDMAATCNANALN